MSTLGKRMKLLNQEDLMNWLRCSRPTLLAMRKRSDFPMPVTGRLLWLEKDIKSFLERSKTA